MFKGRSGGKGFTLIEIVIVVIILGILAAVAVPKFVDIAAGARESATKGGLGALRAAVALFYSSTTEAGFARFPSSTIELRNVLREPVPRNQMMTALTAAAQAGISLSGSVAINTGWTYDSVNGRVYAGNNSEW